MGDKSAIQWTDATWSPVTGCTRVSEGCRNCYAEALTGTRLANNPRYAGLTRLTTDGPRWTGEVRCHEDLLTVPLRWKKPRMIFVNSMSDTFHPDVPFEFVVKLFAIMALCPQHTFQVLTKRPERAAEYLLEWFGAETHDGIWSGLSVDPSTLDIHMSSGHEFSNYRRFPWPLPNVWIGTSIEDCTVLHRTDELRRCPAAIRFLSIEPLIGPIGSLRFFLDGIHWVIVGGESGRGARPMNLAWARSIVQQCKEAGVAVFVKQLGSKAFGWSSLRPEGVPHEWPAGHNSDIEKFPSDLRVREWPK